MELKLSNNRFYSKKFPKLSVKLISATENARQVIAHSYIECVEDRNLETVEEISDEEATKVTKWVLEGGHTPSLESVHLMFNIRGMSRVVSHQIVRHRVGVSIDQRTQRANSEEFLGNIFTNSHYILPPSILNNTSAHSIAYDLVQQSEMVYNRLIKMGIPEDEARYIMPHCAETSMNFKVIYKALQHICSVRLCHMMQGEMIEIFRLMAMAVKCWDGLLGDHLKPTCLITGVCNRNENNPDGDNPKGACVLTIDDVVPCRERNDTYNLTKFSKDNG